jgi:hypothetical protein
MDKNALSKSRKQVYFGHFWRGIMQHNAKFREDMDISEVNIIGEL